jgi:hypothetical protein
MRTRTTLAVALAGAALAAGCGGDDEDPKAPAAQRPATAEAAPARQRAAKSNKRRDGALACIRSRGIEAVGVGPDDIQIRRPGSGPLVRFFTNSGLAEGLQFQGDAEGSQQIGAALLYTRDASEQELDELEACLMDQA